MSGRREDNIVNKNIICMHVQNCEIINQKVTLFRKEKSCKEIKFYH